MRKRVFKYIFDFPNVFVIAVKHDSFSKINAEALTLCPIARVPWECIRIEKLLIPYTLLSEELSFYSRPRGEKGGKD